MVDSRLSFNPKNRRLVDNATVSESKELAFITGVDGAKHTPELFLNGLANTRVSSCQYIHDN